MKPVLLVIRDGWGENHDPKHDKFNAVKLANIPVSRGLTKDWPRTEIMAHGLDVGLPVGIMGNSEVGHQNIGAGRIVDQEIVRIDKGLTDPAAMRQIKAFRGLVENVKATGGAVHLMGLCSEAGVHSTLPHLYALLRLLKEEGLSKVFIHAFMDGRDSPPTSGLGYLKQLEAELLKIGIGKVASVAGRFWAMDRDNRWERVAEAVAVILRGEGNHSATPHAAITAAYERSETDEFITATALAGYKGVQDGDGLFCLNFRADRAREILKALLEPGFDAYDVGPRPDWAATLGMVEYSEAHSAWLDTVFPSRDIRNTLGEWVAKHGRRQFRVAETEKYPHVTFFLNGGKETPEEGEDRYMAPSPKVATYDMQPEMSAAEVTEALVGAIGRGYDLIVVNYANPDMVGHTGDLKAAMLACEAVDRGLAAVVPALHAAGGAMIVTADHGNCEVMVDPLSGGPHTAHTLNPVPVALVGGPKGARLRSGGRLADLAPTLLDLMGLPKPPEMTGESLLQ